MRWTPRGRSSNLEDRRGSRGAMAGMGVGGTLILVVLGLLFGGDFMGGDGGNIGYVTEGGGLSAADSAAEEPMVQFMSFVLDDAQQVWEDKFIRAGQQYRDAKLVLYRDATQTGCGTGQAGMGPFYCPLDETVYLDLAFFSELSRRFGAPGDFAQAYVMAHEIGHHVQHLIGTDEQMRSAQRSNPSAQNELSVRLELQADCYAGVWAHSTARRDLLERGDVEEGLGAAAAVGDDTIQGRMGGGVNPESFTHGTAAQRTAWFRRGLESGDPNACNTFGAS